VQSILSVKGKMNKGARATATLAGRICVTSRTGAWYDGSFAKKGQSVHAIKGIEEHQVRRNYCAHSERRRSCPPTRSAGDKGFSGPALQQYSIYIKNRAEEFVDNLKKRIGTDVDLSLWCSWLAFDTMGDVGTVPRSHRSTCQ
jgi:hypothetical protein